MPPRRPAFWRRHRSSAARVALGFALGLAVGVYWLCPAALAPTHFSSAPPEEAPAAARVPAQATAAPTAASTRDVALPVELAVTLPRSRREPAPPKPPRTKAPSAPHRLEPPKPVAADVGRSHPKPACTSCKSGGAEDGGVAVVGGA